MKTTFVRAVAAISLASLLAGCTTYSGRPDYTANGALIGGASGAAIGALADRRAPGVGALIGGAAGLIAGGLVGHSMDQEREAEEARWATPPPPVAYAPPAGPPPSVNDIKSMAKSGMSDDVIIAQISNTRAVYHLDADTLIDLHNAGVSQKVIAYMVNTANQVVTQAPPAPPTTETVVVAPSPDYVWVDGEWTWNGVGWVWVGGRWVLPPFGHAIWVRARWEHVPRGWYRVGGHWR